MIEKYKILEKYKTEFEEKNTISYGPTKVTVKTLLQNKSFPINAFLLNFSKNPEKCIIISTKYCFQHWL